MYQKMGLVKPFATDNPDVGRKAITVMTSINLYLKYQHCVMSNSPTVLPQWLGLGFRRSRSNDG